MSSKLRQTGQIVLDFWHRLSGIGQPQDEPEEARKITLVNQIAFFGIVVPLGYNIFYAVYDVSLLAPAIIINVLGMTLCLTVLLLNHKGDYQLARWILVTGPNLQIFALTYYLSTATGMHLLHIMMASFPLLLVTKSSTWIKIVFSFMPIGFYLVSYLVFTPESSPIRLPEDIMQIMYVIVSVSVFALVILFLYLFHMEVVRAERLLNDEYKRSESLLMNILPESVASELKTDSRSIAERYDSATVLFCDIVGFTRMASSMEPGYMIELLNQIFSRFDEYAEKHELEKIKTVGDSYMVAGGVPALNDNHITNMANFALDIKEFINTSPLSNPGINVRIGFHTGPVIAGVIGRKKFAYDIWGDTVNIASRMESHGIPGEIHVSETVYQAMRNDFIMVYRGMTPVKGMHDMRTYLLKRQI